MRDKLPGTRLSTPWSIRRRGSKVATGPLGIHDHLAYNLRNWYPTNSAIRLARRLTNWPICQWPWMPSGCETLYCTSVYANIYLGSGAQFRIRWLLPESLGWSWQWYFRPTNPTRSSIALGRIFWVYTVLFEVSLLQRGVSSYRIRCWIPDICAWRHFDVASSISAAFGHVATFISATFRRRFRIKLARSVKQTQYC